MAQAKPVPPLSSSDIDRFWYNVSITANPNLCWEWTSGSQDKNGYSRMHLTGGKFKGQYNVRCNRIAYFIGKKENPNSLVVCHTCDNPKCCNPSHLFLGTPYDNRIDCVKKGRQAKGQTHGSVTKPEALLFGERNGHYTKPESTPRGNNHWKIKVTEAQVKEIIELYLNGGISQQKIADKYKISQANVSYIVMGKGWKHLHQPKKETA